MAVCDSNYKFTMVDIGDSGRNSDGGIFSSCNLGIAVNEDKLNIPKAEALPFLLYLLGMKHFLLEVT